MLNRLTINNYAIIDRIEIDFPNHLTIITGETGAGKSILLGALSLILGQRADSKSLYNNTSKCVIEGQFNISAYELKNFFGENDLDYDDNTTLRREIAIDGKSRAFINDTPVNLSTLKSLGEQLVDIHSQHETLELNSDAFQLMVVDSFCEHKELLHSYKEHFRSYKNLSNLLNELIEQSKKSLAEKDYLQFQYEELDAAKLDPNEQEILEQEQTMLTHAEEIKKGLSSILFILNENENSVEQQLKIAGTQIQSLEKYHAPLNVISERLKSSLIELKDITAEIESTENAVAVDGERLQMIQERLDLIYKLQQKHRVKSNTELIDTYEEIKSKLDSFLTQDEDIRKTEEELTELKKKLISEAKKLSQARNRAIPAIEKDLKLLLTEVGMPDAQIKIQNDLQDENYFSSTGIDKIRFLFSANKGYALEELNKVASGGELSRLMLCIKSMTAKFTALPTIIFDEIDTGVSGEIAMKVGNIMQKLSHSLQVISITHLPQIASKGNSHLFVYKENRGAQTFTNIRKLNKEERINEIAKMLSGEIPTASAVENAKELLQM